MKLHPDSQAVRCRKKLNLASAALTACCFFSSSSSSSSIGPSLSMVIESIRLPGRVECNTGVDSAQRQGRAHGPPFCGKNDRSPKYGILCQVRLTFPGGLPERINGRRGDVRPLDSEGRTPVKRQSERVA